MTRLIDDLLDVTRISKGKIHLQRERVDLGAIARATAEDHRELFAKCGVELVVEEAGEPLHVNGDPARLAQVIGNLLGNAVKFTPRGGHARMTLQCGDRGDAILRVRDDGAGIAPEALERIFEPFMQAETTLDRSRGGLGLGLALVKALVELHGGTVTAESRGPGEGATFTVRLPLDAPASRPARGAPAPESGGARRVLVIEDNVDAADSLKEALANDRGTSFRRACSEPGGAGRSRGCLSRAP